MTETELFNLVQQVHLQFKKRSLRKLQVQFHPYRSLRHTVRQTPLRISVKISERLQYAPRHIIEIVAHLLFSRIYKKSPDRQMRRAYRDYCDTVFPQMPAPVTGYQSLGVYYDLRARFDYLNQTYFNSQLSVRHIGWSKRISMRRLGFYDKTRSLLVISRKFDHAATPREVIDFLLYHEMLHVKFPAVERNGRRVIHSKKFREAERQFPDYDSINKQIVRIIK